MPRWLRLSLAWLLFAAMAQAQALPPGPDGKPLGQLGKQIEARFLYPAGKFFEYNTLFPVVIEYQNLTSQPQYFTLDWSLHIPIPQEYKTLLLEGKAKKRIPLLLPSREVSQMYSISVNKQNVSSGLQGNSQGRVTGLLSANSESLDYLRALQIEKNPYYNPSNQDQNEEYTVLTSLSQLNHEVFPQHWAELSALKVIVCYDLNALAFGNSQYRILERWVQQGGHLVVMSNGIPNEYKGTPIEALLPLTPNAVETRQGRISVTGPLKDDARIGLGSPEDPLLISRDVIDGKVHFVTSPLLDTNLLGKEKTQELWRVVFDDLGQTNSRRPLVFDYSTLNNIPELPRTGAGWVALFVLLYGIVVGPINLSILRKRDKMLQAFISVPLIAFFFAGGAYVLNRVVRPSTPVLRELGWLQIQADQQTGIAESELVHGTPTPETFTMSSGQNAFLDIAPNSYRSSSNKFGLYRVTPDGGLESEIDLGTWDIQRFVSLSVLSLDSPFSIKMVKGPSQVTITSPLAGDGVSATISYPEGNFSDPFELKSGTHTYDLVGDHHNPIDALIFDDQEAPGRRTLVDRVWNQATSDPSRGSLFVWTSQVNNSLDVDHEAIRRQDFLVTVEFER